MKYLILINALNFSIVTSPNQALMMCTPDSKSDSSIPFDSVNLYMVPHKGYMLRFVSISEQKKMNFPDYWMDLKREGNNLGSCNMYLHHHKTPGVFMEESPFPNLDMAGLKKDDKNNFVYQKIPMMFDMSKDFLNPDIKTVLVNCKT